MAGAANPHRLTPFEQYMLADDRAAYPMDFFFRFGFAGRLNYRHLADSLASTAARHPLVTANVKRGSRDWKWRTDTVTPRLHDLTSSHGQHTTPFSRIDLTRQSGLQAWFGSNDQNSDLWLQVHHAFADAVGILLFLKQWLANYEQLERGEGHPADSPATNGALQRTLSQRFTTVDLSPWRYLSPSRQERQRLFGFALNRPRRISLPEGPAPSEAASASRPGLVSAKLALTREIWKSAKAKLSAPASLNDVLLDGVFRAICAWNDERANATRRYCLRVALPMDLRTATGHTAEAMNNVSMVFLDRSAREIRAEKGLLAGIQRETDWIKRNHGAFVLHDVLNALQPLPGGIASLVAPITCTATTVLSNLGELSSYLPHSDKFRVAGATLENLDFLPPIRPGTLAALGVVTYAGHLHISMHFDQQKMSQSVAASLLGRITDLWRRSLAA